MHQIGATVDEVSALLVGDVYRYGAIRKSVQLGSGARQRTALLDDGARKIVRDTLIVQSHHGLSPRGEAPLFPTPSGKAFTPEQLASFYWTYQEAGGSISGIEWIRLTDGLVTLCCNGLAV